MTSSVTHVIFDMDGLLLNTEDLYTKAFKNICKPFGKEYTWKLKIPCMGKKPQDAARYIIEELDIPLTVDQWLLQLNEQLDTIFSHAQIMPGATKLVNHLKKHNIPMAICSGSSQAAFNAKTSHIKEFFSHFSPVVLCGSDEEVQHSKPHPDPYNVTRKRFSPSPDAKNVLVFEDAPNGVKSAIAANMRVVMVPHENVPKEFTEDATLVLKSLEDFKPEDFGLPCYT